MENSDAVMPRHAPPQARAQHPVKILFLLWDGIIGGITETLADLTRHAPSDRYHFTICLLSRSGPSAEAMRRPNVEIVELGAGSGLDAGAFVRLCAFLAKRRYHLIHNNTRTYFGHLAVLMTARKTPRLYQEWGDLHTEGDARLSGFSYRLFSWMYKRFLTLSEDTVDAMVAVGVDRSRVTNVANSIDVERFMPEFPKEKAKAALGLGAGDVVVGTACRFVPQKDLPLFLATAQHIHRARPHVRFVLVGGGRLEARLKSMAAELGLEEVIHFPGIRTDMPVVFRAFDVFCLTSHQESFGKTIVESLSSAVPVVSVVPRYGGGRNLVLEGDGIRYVHERDPSSLCRLILPLIDRPAEARRLGLEGRRWVASQSAFRAGNWTRQLLAIYQEVMGRSPCGHRRPATRAGRG